MALATYGYMYQDIRDVLNKKPDHCKQEIQDNISIFIYSGGRAYFFGRDTFVSVVILCHR